MKNKLMDKKIVKFLVGLFCGLLYTLHFTPCTAFAAPHISGKRIHGQPKDHVHKLPDVNKLRAKGLAPQAIREAIGATGTKKVAVVLVNFSGLGSNTYSASDTINKFSNIQNYISELKIFYQEVSYNNINLEFDYYPSSTTAYSLTQTMAYYGYVDADTENGDILIKGAIAKNSNIKHKNSGGIYDAVIVVHAGYGNEAVGNSSNTGDVWSAFYDKFTNTQGFTEGVTVPETAPSGLSPFGVYCHEFGHQLGLPDLYNTISGATQVGKWCLMDMGTWSSGGANPSHPSIWCKQLLGWVSPVSISSVVINASLSAIEVTTQGTKIPISVATDPNNEYFLLEYRYTSAASYDQGLPGSGILIWHIDDNIGGGSGHWDFGNYNDINNNSLHRRVDLEEADSTDPSSNRGDLTDPWTKNTFNSPRSDAYNGTPSGITVLNFTGVGSSTMNFSVSFQPWIRGYVRDSAGTGISGITVTAMNVSTKAVATTDSTGQYLLNLDSGTYTLNPSTASYRFYPSSRTVTVVDSSSNQDFTATLRTEVTASAGSLIIPENNVFNPAKGEKTTIWYKIPETNRIKLKIYTFDGILVKTLIDDYKDAGYYTESWYGKNDAEETVASGIYLLYFDVDGTNQIKKIAIIK